MHRGKRRLWQLNNRIQSQFEDYHTLCIYHFRICLAWNKSRFGKWRTACWNSDKLASHKMNVINWVVVCPALHAMLIIEFSSLNRQQMARAPATLTIAPQMRCSEWDTSPKASLAPPDQACPPVNLSPVRPLQRGWHLDNSTSLWLGKSAVSLLACRILPHLG